jgi:hypothetical protein
LTAPSTSSLKGNSSISHLPSKQRQEEEQLLPSSAAASKKEKSLESKLLGFSSDEDEEAKEQVENSRDSNLKKKTSALNSESMKKPTPLLHNNHHKNGEKKSPIAASIVPCMERILVSEEDLLLSARVRSTTSPVARKSIRQSPNLSTGITPINLEEDLNFSSNNGKKFPSKLIQWIVPKSNELITNMQVKPSSSSNGIHQKEKTVSFDPIIDLSRSNQRSYTSQDDSLINYSHGANSPTTECYYCEVDIEIIRAWDLVDCLGGTNAYVYIEALHELVPSSSLLLTSTESIPKKKPSSTTVVLRSPTIPNSTEPYYGFRHRMHIPIFHSILKNEDRKDPIEDVKLLISIFNQHQSISDQLIGVGEIPLNTLLCSGSNSQAVYLASNWQQQEHAGCLELAARRAS